MTNSKPAVTTVLASQDVSAIRAIIDDVEGGFNDNDVERSLRHFAEDAVVVNAVGHVLEGVAAISEAVADGLANKLAAATAHYEPFAIAAVGPSVAVANKRAWSSRSDAEAGAPVEMVALYVFVRSGDRWWIARRENTLTVQPTTV